MEGDPADEMFFIKSGKVAAVLSQYNNFKFLKVKAGKKFKWITITNKMCSRDKYYRTHVHTVFKPDIASE